MNPEQLSETRTAGAVAQSRAVQRVTAWGLAVNLLLSAVKFILGVFGNSQALVADGVHSLSDSVTDVVVIVGAKYWSAPADADHPHGHGRIETLITLLIGAVLAAVGVGLVYKALSTLSVPHQTSPGWIVFFAACVSMVSKEILYRRTIAVSRKIGSTALSANAWHHRSDGFSSLPVAIAVLGTKLRPEWFFLDHIGAIVVSLLILQAAWKILWPALNQLTDIGVGREERMRLHDLVRNIHGVREVHAIRTRHIGSGVQVDLHVLVDPKITVRAGHEIARDVKYRLINDVPDVVDVLVHVEPFDDNFSRQYE
ncbi:MAG: cation transporter [candidate division Zixibacteria bacterium]|nr:cation transporter [candidate division Zixibacteria bacterium]